MGISGTNAGLTLIPGIGQLISTDGSVTFSPSNGAAAVVDLSVVGGSSDVVGPASSTDNAIARFDGTTGKLIQNSGATIDDSGNLTANTGAFTNGVQITANPSTGILQTIADTNLNFFINGGNPFTIATTGNISSVDLALDTHNLTFDGGTAQIYSSASQHLDLNSTKNIDLRISGGSVLGITGTQLTIADGVNVDVGTVVGTIWGVDAAASLQAWWGKTPVAQPGLSTAIDTLLTTLGFRKSGGIANFDTKLNIPSLSASTTEGDFWKDSTQKAIGTFTDGIKQMLSGTIFTQTADKTVTNTVTETSIVGTGVGGLTLPANFFVAGKTIRVTMSGVYSTVAVTGDTVTVKIKYGSTVLASKATTALVTGGTNLAWFSDALITCRTTGTTGTVQVSGGVRYQIAGSAIVEDELNNGAATTTLNTTTSNLFDVTITHSAANASNTVKSLVSSFEVLN